MGRRRDGSRKSDEGDVTLEVKGREPEFEVCFRDGTTGDKIQAGGVIQGRLETDVIESGLLEGGAGELDSLDDLVTMGLKGDVTIEDVTQVGEFCMSHDLLDPNPTNTTDFIMMTVHTVGTENNWYIEYEARFKVTVVATHRKFETTPESIWEEVDTLEDEIQFTGVWSYTTPDSSPLTHSRRLGVGRTVG